MKPVPFGWKQSVARSRLRVTLTYSTGRGDLKRNISIGISARIRVIQCQRPLCDWGEFHCEQNEQEFSITVSLVYTPLHAPIPTEVNKYDNLILSDQCDRSDLTPTYKRPGFQPNPNILKKTNPKLTPMTP
jgi:hypothetical protein